MAVCRAPLRCLSKQKDGEVEVRSSTIRVAYLSHVGSLPFILELILDYRKDNLVILVIRFFFPYQGLVLPYRGLTVFRHMRFGHWETRG